MNDKLTVAKGNITYNIYSHSNLRRWLNITCE